MSVVNLKSIESINDMYNVILNSVINNVCEFKADSGDIENEDEIKKELIDLISRKSYKCEIILKKCDDKFTVILIKKSELRSNVVKSSDGLRFNLHLNSNANDIGIIGSYGDYYICDFSKRNDRSSMRIITDICKFEYLIAAFLLSGRKYKKSIFSSIYNFVIDFFNVVNEDPLSELKKDDEAILNDIVFKLLSYSEPSNKIGRASCRERV